MTVPGILALLLLVCYLPQHEAASYHIRSKTRAHGRFNYFDVELLQEMSKAEPGNIIVSPASIKAALAMLYEGAGGSSEKELQNVLRLPDDKAGSRAHFQRFLLSLQRKSPYYLLDIGNKIYVNNLFPVNPEYVHILRTNYFADLENVNFTNSILAAHTINDWIKNTTHGLIPEIVSADKLSEETKLFIANAIYFKGNWDRAFDVDGTKLKCFYSVPDKCQYTYMMEHIDYYKYANIEELDSQVVELLYEDKKYSMVIILPNKKDGINQLIRDLQHNQPDNFVDELELTEMQVSIPRFKIDYTNELGPTLYHLGIKDIFTNHANLSAITHDPALKITNILHKAKIEVNEEGSIAGAATGVQVVPLIGSVSHSFMANHPFIFFIRDLETGHYIFMGKVTDPGEIPAADTPSFTGNSTNFDAVIQEVFTRPATPTPSHLVNATQSYLNTKFSTGNQRPYQPSSGNFNKQDVYSFPYFSPNGRAVENPSNRNIHRQYPANQPTQQQRQ